MSNHVYITTQPLDETAVISKEKLEECKKVLNKYPTKRNDDGLWDIDGWNNPECKDKVFETSSIEFINNDKENWTQSAIERFERHLDLISIKKELPTNINILNEMIYHYKGMMFLSDMLYSTRLARKENELLVEALELLKEKYEEKICQE